MTLARRLAAAAAAIAVVLIAGFFAVGARIESFVNRVRPVALPAVQPATHAVHDGSFVVDLHADSLLFGRDLLVESGTGHIDLPRLQRGGVGLQVFATTTVAPLGFNAQRNDADAFDLLTAAGVAQLSPLATRSPFGRALLQAERLRAFAARSGGQMLPILRRADLDALIARRQRGERPVGALLAVEGMHLMSSPGASLDELYAQGFRMAGLAHFFDNDYAGSVHGATKHGLTPRGRELIGRLEDLGMAVDLAHTSSAAIDDVLATARKPVVVSHTGVRGTCDNSRNLSDEQIRGVARTGGVIGIGYWEMAVCGLTPAHVSRAIRHVVGLVGDTHVALGSDFDGATTTGFDTSGLPSLTQQLLDDGLSPESVRRILGENAVRVLRVTLPP